MLLQFIISSCLLFSAACLAQFSVHDPMDESVFFYPRPVDMPHHVYVKPTDLVTRDSTMPPTPHRLQLVTDWPYPGVMASHTLKPTDLVATADINSQPIYFRGVDNAAHVNLSKKKNILYLAFPVMRHYVAQSET